jgi:uncharacterized protein
MNHSSDQHPTMPAGTALAIVVLALLLGLFFNAADILRTAERQEAGWVRSLAVGLAQPIADAAGLLRLDRPRASLDVALGRAPTDPTVAPPTTQPAEAAPTTTTTVTQERVVSATEPLRVYVGGDSMVGQFGPMLENLAERTDLAEVEVRYEFVSGLTRPDFLDWNVVLAEVATTSDPETLVLFFGGNDAQDIRIEGRWEPFGTDAWLAEYRARVAAVMDAMEPGGRQIWWIGMPIVSSESFRQKLLLLNEIYRSEAESRPHVHYIDTWVPFSGPDGGYAEFLPNADGDVVDMRLNDGVHLTTAGGIKLARLVWADIAGEYGITTG